MLHGAVFASVAFGGAGRIPLVVDMTQGRGMVDARSYLDFWWNYRMFAPTVSGVISVSNSMS